MRKGGWLMLGALTLLSLAQAAQWSGAWKPLGASYTIYSGDLPYREAPTQAERMMTIYFEGRPAEDLFNSIGPDMPSRCSDEKGDRHRSKKGVECSYSPREQGAGYRCWIGLDLRTGDSTPTVPC